MSKSRGRATRTILRSVVAPALGALLTTGVTRRALADPPSAPVAARPTAPPSATAPHTAGSPPMPITAPPPGTVAPVGPPLAGSPPIREVPRNSATAGPTTPPAVIGQVPAPGVVRPNDTVLPGMPPRPPPGPPPPRDAGVPPPPGRRPPPVRPGMPAPPGRGVPEVTPPGVVRVPEHVRATEFRNDNDNDNDLVMPYRVYTTRGRAAADTPAATPGAPSIEFAGLQSPAASQQPAEGGDAGDEEGAARRRSARRASRQLPGDPQGGCAGAGAVRRRGIA